MPEYDDSFLLDCERLERKKWRSYSINRGVKDKLFKNRFIKSRGSYGFLDEKNCDSGTSTPCSSIGSSGHKGSLRGTKLARRARSFKDDFLEKISQIRTPTSTMTRSHSPNSPRSRNVKSHQEETLKPVHDLDYHVRQVKHALTHFKDVISKNKLEMLPGNGTVVLESIANVHTALQTFTLNEHSSSLISATTQVNLSLGKLIKLCDEVLISEDGKNCASLNKDNVKEVVELVENAIMNLVALANEKITEREKNESFNNTTKSTSNTLQRPTVDVVSQRTSLPDIPLTPRERDILEQTSVKSVRASHSTESILRDTSPPPKPPLPNRSTDPPPLPPKRSSHKQTYLLNDSDCISDASFLACGLDRMSLRSRSPEDNSSLLSASAGSLDSALNHSREEDELRALTMDNSLEETSFNSDLDRIKNLKENSFQKWDETDYATPVLTVPGILHPDSISNRHSNESGFVSMHSLRSSIQSSNTRRSSQQNCSSFLSQQKLSTASSSVIQKSDSILESLLENTQQQHKSSASYSSSSISNLSQKVDESLSVSKIRKDGTQNNVESSISMKLAKQVSSETVKTSDNEFSKQRSINMSSLSSLSKLASIDRNSIDLNDDVFMQGDIPPALPVKTRRKSTRRERHISQYDNVEENETNEQNTLNHNLRITSQTQLAFINKQHLELGGLPRKHQSLIEPRHMKHYNDDEEDDGSMPPPLPMKKKHIMAYMEIFGNCSHTPQNSSEFLRHSVHTYNVSHSSEHITQSLSKISHSHTMSLSPQQTPHILQSPAESPICEKPPALPPKRLRANSKTPSITTTPPPSPKVQSTKTSPSNSMLNSAIVKVSTQKPVQISLNTNNNDKVEVKKDIETNNLDNKTNSKEDEVEVVLRRNQVGGDQNGTSTKSDQSLNLMEEIDVKKYLVYKKESEDGPDIKGGHPDALIIHATKAAKKADAYGEAFITTFRTFISPLNLIEKLTYRYKLFECQISDPKQRAANESFSLLVRVVNDLTAPDVTVHLMKLLVDFVFQLVCSGKLMLAKLLRVKIIEKILIYKQHKLLQINLVLSARPLTSSPPLLIDLKSSEIAEQMTLLDAELFQKIEIPEVLIWAQEQCEERSPNLTLFTEHFNKMSYWARSQILKQEDAKDREKHVIKFIKIMKHLRKINNYNSYLALLSALDSAPIRRLEWHKTITEGLNEYCALIDSSSSFRAYRQALAETNPPCIPYIGLVLQDLTFVHIGNQDHLGEGKINFSKRWQQYNIVVNMKRFRKCTYSFKKNERIIQFFDNFENYLDEDAMWQISENIKPRGGRKQLAH